MTSLGAVIAVGAAPRTARSLDSLVRQTRALDQVTLVVGPAIDARVADWLDATSAARSWTLVRATCETPGAMLNAGLAATTAEWVVALDAGDVLVPSAAATLDATVAASRGSDALIAGAARLVSLGIDQTSRPESPGDVAAFDPAHPALRAVCWRRSAVETAGGFDPELIAVHRYDLWLRLLAAGRTARSTDETLVQLSLEGGEPLPAELDHSGYRDAVRVVLTRHEKLLTPRVGDLLEARANRVDALGRLLFQAFERDRAFQAHVAGDPDTPPRRLSGLPRRVTPLSRNWGYERGGPLDRVYIERFVQTCAADIRGTVLEVQEPDYTRRFGGLAVTASHVVDLAESNLAATVITDLRAAANIHDATYDCVILTQTLHVIAPMAEVVSECHRILKPGGVLLVTLPSVSRVCLEYGRDGDYWRVTPAGARHLFEPTFGDGVAVTAFGNATSGAAFLYGLGSPEVDDADLSWTDIYNPVLVGVRAVKQGATTQAPVIATGRSSHGLVLLYHRVGGTGPDPHHINLDVDTFDRQMAWLGSNCTVLPLGELVTRASSGRLPARAAAITFDDGYLDTLTVAAPILSRYGLTATCFVATDGLDGSHVFWWDRLAALLLGAGPRPSLLTLALPDGPLELPTTTSGERLFAHGLVYHAIVAIAAPARDGVLDQLATWAPGVMCDDDCRRMSAVELLALAHRDVSLGAHTVHHPQLPRFDRATQVQEMAESRAVLERIAGAEVRHFAYPFGAVDDRTVTSAQEAGFTHAFTCEPRAIVAGEAPLRLPRLDPQEPRLDRFIARVTRSLSGDVS